uniref:Uncharacterized protein n=1 Tax=Daucus carota subsp. sativus TaxID=79200 RepID=A0A165A477_DAUCS
MIHFISCKNTHTQHTLKAQQIPLFLPSFSHHHCNCGVSEPTPPAASCGRGGAPSSTLAHNPAPPYFLYKSLHTQNPRISIFIKTLASILLVNLKHVYVYLS